MRKLKYLSLILMLSVLMFGQYEIPIENLLTNSGFGVWSQSDAAKGIAALTYDTGSAGGGDIPDVGDAVTGGASGATGKIMSMTIATGTFAGNNATGTIQLGSTTGCFNDDEVLAFTDGETAVTNHPDGAVGADKLVENGAFVHNIDPPNDWTASNATLSTEAGGQVGNCLMVTESGAGVSGAAWQAITVEIGKIYKFSTYFKNGTADSGTIYLGTTELGSQIWTSGAINDVGWTEYIHTFEATTTTMYITLWTAGDNDTTYFDEVTLYETTPGVTAAVGSNAFDGAVRITTAHIYREHWGANTKEGSFYSLKFVPQNVNDYFYFFKDIFTTEEHYKQYAGRTVTYGAWVLANVANHAKLRIWDSAGSSDTSFHSGGGTFEWLEVTRTMGAGITNFYVGMIPALAGNIDGTTIVYVSQHILAFGSSIGSGNYSPRQHEVILLEKAIISNTLNNITSQSDLAVGDLNIEADSDAMLPKGCKAVKILTQCNDSASAGTDCYLTLRAGATKGYEYYNSPYGLANDIDNRISGWIQCDFSGDIDRYLNASGANTFDLDVFKYVAVQVTN